MSAILLDEFQSLQETLKRVRTSLPATEPGISEPGTSVRCVS